MGWPSPTHLSVGYWLLTLHNMPVKL